MLLTPKNMMNRWLATHIVLRGLVPAGVLCLLVVGACVPGEGGAPQTHSSPQEVSGLNTLTEAEKEVGWELLFDGETFEGWTGLGRDTIPVGHWAIEDGAIKKVKSGNVPPTPDGQPLAGEGGYLSCLRIKLPTPAPTSIPTA